MSKKLPIIAIVGRANVGKSSLFNAILDRRETIIAKEAGTTRDAITAKAEHEGQNFWIVDTAGIKDPEDDFEFTIQEQILQAADSADLIVVVVEGGTIVTEEDRKVAKLALRSKKPVFLVVNKMDKVKGDDISEYLKLGIKEIIRTSATQKQGIDYMLNQLVAAIPKVVSDDNPDVLSIAIVGRPNVGKSQLFNTLSKKQQAIVANLAGTTRDVNRNLVKYKGKDIQLLDTAGIRRNGKIEVGIERFSVIRALKAIEESDVCFLLIDVNDLHVQLDQKIAGLVKEAGKGLVLVVSKWDAVQEKDAFTRDDLAPKIVRNYEFVPWAPLIFTSAVTGQNVTKLFDIALDIEEARSQQVTTRELNKWLREAIDAHPPAGMKNRSPKLNYVTQETDNPVPSFKIYGSSTKFIHWSYKRYLETRFRKAFGFEGSPIELWFIEKHIAHKHGVSPTKIAQNER
jgi:GTP-binding protein